MKTVNKPKYHLYDQIPVGDATELEFDAGWKQWDLAVKLQDKDKAKRCAEDQGGH